MSVVRAASWEWSIPHAVHYFSCDHLWLVQKIDSSFS
jgi:hypothetical protein